MGRRVSALVTSVFLACGSLAAIPAAPALAAYVTPPSLVVFPAEDRYEGNGWPDGATVTITVADKAACSGHALSSGGFFGGDFPPGCDVVPGDGVTFTDGETTRIHTVRFLVVTAVDAAADTVAGTAVAGDVIHVSVAGDGGVDAIASGSPMWIADFSALTDITYLTTGRAEITDAAGNATAVSWWGDTIPPVITLVSRTPANANGWNNGDVMVTWSCTDSETGPVAPAITSTISADGANQAATGTCADMAHNTASATVMGINVDKSSPVISCPAAGPFVLHTGDHLVGPAGVDASVAGLDSALSTLTGVVETDSVGSHSVVFTATDLAGNVATRSCSYDVAYGFAGFYGSVASPPALNVVRAGAAVAVTFALAGDQGLDVFATGYPRSQPVVCTNIDQTLDAALPTQTAGGSGLQYDPATGRYTYPWKTNKAWAGTCRTIVVRFVDGTEHRAAFRFTK